MSSNESTFLHDERSCSPFGSAFPLPHDEAERLADLKALDLLDSPHEPAYDGIVEIAAALVGAPIATLSLIDSHRMWVKASVGATLREINREDSFCAHTIMASSNLVVEDLSADPRFRHNPFVTHEPHLRFYAGIPLTTYHRRQVGTLCVVDTRPRQIEVASLRLLERLARLAVDAMETRRTQARVHQSLSGWVR